MERHLGRRKLLAGVGVGVTAMAGCLTTLNPLGQKIRYGDIDEPAAGEPVYRDWIPDELGSNGVPGSNSGLGYQVPGERGEETLGAPPMYYDELVKRTIAGVGVDFGSFEYVVRIGETTLCRASFDRGRVEQAVLDRRAGGIVSDGGYEQAGAHRGVDIYTRGGPQPAQTIAVGDELLVFADDPGHVEEILDTGAGSRARRHETDDAFGRLVDTLGGMPITDLHQVDDEGDLLASGSGRLFDDSAAYIVSVDVYADDADISRADIEGELADGSMGPLPLDANRVDLRIDDPVVTQVYQYDHDTYEDVDGPLFVYPLVTWGFDYDGEALTITHRAGTDLDTSRYTLRDVRRMEPTDDQFGDRYGTIEPGDTLTVDLGSRGEWHLRLEGDLPGDDTHQAFDVTDAQFEEQHSPDTDNGPGTDGQSDDD